MSGFSLCTFTAFLCRACDDMGSVEGSFSFTCIWTSRMFVSLAYDACDPLEKMGIMSSLPDFGFDMALGYMANCCSFDLEYPRCTLSCFPYNLSIGKLSDFPWHSLFLTHCRNAEGRSLRNCVSPASSLPTIQGHERQWLSEYHLSEVPGSERPLEVPELIFLKRMCLMFKVKASEIF